MKRLSHILIALLCPLCIFSQLAETIIVGEIYDHLSGEPLPNVNVVLQGTSYGTISSPEGLFLLRCNINKPRQMIVSAIGYHTQRFRIEPGMQVGIDIEMQEKVNSLNEVFVVPGANPALPLMEQVRKYRQYNSQLLVQTTDHSKQNVQTALFVSDIQAKHLRRTLWKNLQHGMIQQGDSTYLIPLYWRHQQPDTICEQATLLTSTEYQMLLAQMPTTYDFYDNTLPILSMSMLSPLATSGNTYYNYYLADSTYVGNEKHYTIHFRTKNTFYATFNGELIIDSATYALRSISATVPVQTNINYLKQLTIKQSFAPNNALLQENLSMLLDFAIKSDTSHIFPTLLITRATQYPLSDNLYPITNSRYPIIDTLSTTPDIAEPIHMQITQSMDSLRQTPLFKVAEFAAYILQTGNIPTSKYVEVGPVNKLLDINRYAGVQVGIPLSTTPALWKNVAMNGYVSYGTKDRAWKGMGQIEVALPSVKRHIFRIRYSDDYIFSDVNDFQEYIRENNIFDPQINLITRIMRAAPFNEDYYYNTITRRREGRVHFENEWHKNIETQGYIKVGRLGYGEVSSDYDAQPSFFYSTLGASVRLSYDERVVDSYFHRRHIYNHLPVLYLGAELGSYTLHSNPSTEGAYHMYGNIQLMLRHNIDMGMAGHLHYLLQAGMIFGRVPYPLLHIFTSNQTHTFDIHRFSLMNNYQYGADQYVSIQAHWNGKGLLFNLIPGVRYLHLRELLELKVAWGGLRQNHQSVLPFPTGHLSSLQIPYVEAGVGIGNILRVGEVYGVFRLTHLQDNTCPWWALRFRFTIGM